MLSRLTTPFAVVLLVLWLGLGSWWYAATYCGAYTSSGIVPGLSLMDGSYEIAAAETFSFFESGADPHIPNSTEEAFETLALHLIDSQDKRLTLFGIYSPKETNGTQFENLGRARAEAIRNHLMDLGVPRKKIKVKGGSFASASFDAKGLMYGGVFFRFETMNESPNSPLMGVEGERRDLFRPVNIYFDVNEDDLILTDELEAYFEEVKKFLRKNSRAQLSIQGHADRNGSSSSNLSLSETRARNVKKFMIRSGFDPNRLVLGFEGEDDPLSTGKVDKTLRKNRRVELRLLTR